MWEREECLFIRFPKVSLLLSCTRKWIEIHCLEHNNGSVFVYGPLGRGKRKEEQHAMGRRLPFSLCIFQQPVL